MLIHHPIVDRKVEFATFKKVLECSAPENISILLVNDNSGQGKTKLLNLFENHCRKNNIVVSRVDLKGGSLTPINILQTIQTDFRTVDLKRCKDILSKPISLPSTQIARNTGLGQTTYSVQNTVYMANYSSEEQKNWYQLGGQAFLDDLFELKEKNFADRFVILLDTYEQASDETKRWIVDYILRMATPERIDSLLIVVAGKDVPSPTGEWDHCCHTIKLGPLQLQDWIEYAELIAKDIPSEYIERIYARHKDSTIQMANVINALAPVEDLSND